MPTMIPASIDFCLDVSDVGLIDDQFDAYLDVSGLTIGDFLLALLHLLGEHHHDFGVHLSVNSNIITISQSLPSFLQKLSLSHRPRALVLHHALGPVPVHRLSRLPETRRCLVRPSPDRLPLALVVHRLGLQVLGLLLKRVPVGGSLLRLGLGLDLPRKLEWLEVEDVLLKLKEGVGD
jgi:hypothetical protein